MNQQPSPLEERVYKAYWQDGSVDLFAGIGLTCIAVAWIFDLVALGPIAPAIAIPFWVAFRRRVVEPRLGHLRFDEQRQSRLRKAHVTLVSIGCATLALGIVTYVLRTGGRGDGAWVRTLVPALPGALIAVGAIITAIVFSIPRFALYAVPFMLGASTVAILDCDPGWGLLGGGLATTIAGGVLITHFLRNFPVLSSELK